MLTGAAGEAGPPPGPRGSAPDPAAPQSPEGLEFVARRRGMGRPEPREASAPPLDVLVGGGAGRKRQPSLEMSRTAPRSALVAIAA